MYGNPTRNQDHPQNKHNEDNRNTIGLSPGELQGGEMASIKVRSGFPPCIRPSQNFSSREWGSTFGIVFVQLVKSEYQTLARRSQKAADVGQWALPWSVSSKKPRLVAQRYSRDTPILRHVSREACGHLESVTLIGLDSTPQTTE